MRLLLIAYEFPPSPSPQSLRWTYLARELAGRGHDVHVLTIDLGGQTPGLPELPGGVTIHRTFAGPVRGVFALRRKLRMRGDAASSPASSSRSREGWRLAVSDAMQAFLAKVLFPDARGEWWPWAKARLRRLLDEVQPDVVISSHEPATCLDLGLVAQAAGFAWIADLGDPVAAPYTPPHWRERAFALEARVCASADAVLVTSDATRELLQTRHACAVAPVVVTQGFDATRREGNPPAPVDPLRFELLYTGSLYRFRRMDALLDALPRVPEARLSIASITMPADMQKWFARLPAQLRPLGFLSHESALRMQRHVDLLVNLANEDAAQIPGKFYEYLGAGRPILHIGRTDDAVADLLRRTGLGWSCPNDAASIAAVLREAVAARGASRVAAGPDIERHSWQSLAIRVEDVARAAIARRRASAEPMAPAVT